jgi:S-(hydroxymethyl)glutathione dehydrogenase/alcohol dehydrogenase
VGVAAVYGIAPRYLGPGGRLVLVGMPPTGDKTEFEPGDFAAMSQRMIGSKMGDVVLPRDIPWLVELYGTGELKLDEMVSKTWPLDQINEAIADTRSGSARRNVIVF